MSEKRNQFKQTIRILRNPYILLTLQTIIVMSTKMNRDDKREKYNIELLLLFNLYTIKRCQSSSKIKTSYSTPIVTRTQFIYGDVLWIYSNDQNFLSNTFFTIIHHPSEKENNVHETLMTKHYILHFSFCFRHYKLSV